jgi:hypothetical protein
MNAVKLDKIVTFVIILICKKMKKNSLKENSLLTFLAVLQVKKLSEIQENVKSMWKFAK